MRNFLSKLTKGEQARLLAELNYLNLEEIRGFCCPRGIPYKIVAEYSNGKIKATKDIDRTRCTCSGVFALPAVKGNPESNPKSQIPTAIGIWDLDLGFWDLYLKVDLEAEPRVPRRLESCRLQPRPTRDERLVVGRDDVHVHQIVNVDPELSPHSR